VKSFAHGKIHSLIDTELLRRQRCPDDVIKTYVSCKRKELGFERILDRKSNEFYVIEEKRCECTRFLKNL